MCEDIDSIVEDWIMDNFRYESLKPYPGKFEPLREDKTAKIRSQLEKLYRRENEKS